MIFASTGAKQDPIETPSICSQILLSNENAVLLHESEMCFLSVRLDKVVLISFSSKTLFSTNQLSVLGVQS